MTMLLCSLNLQEVGIISQNDLSIDPLLGYFSDFMFCRTLFENC